MLLSSEMFVGLLGKETSFLSRLRAKETFWGTISSLAGACTICP